MSAAGSVQPLNHIQSLKPLNGLDLEKVLFRCIFGMDIIKISCGKADLTCMLLVSYIYARKKIMINPCSVLGQRGQARNLGQGSVPRPTDVERRIKCPKNY